MYYNIPIFDRLLMDGRYHLGDCFVMSGIVNHYADHCRELHLAVGKGYEKTLGSLYKEHPNIRIFIAGEGYGEAEYAEEHKLSRILANDILKTEFVNNTWVPVYWPMHVYDCYDLPFSTRYRNFRVPTYIEGADELYDRLSNGEPYILVHRRPFMGYPDGYPINIFGFRHSQVLPEYRIIEVRPEITEDMMQYVKLIKHAKEIHCVDSSFYQLVDGMVKHTQADLYFHKIRAFSMLRVNCKWNDYRWRIVEYGERM